MKHLYPSRHGRHLLRAAIVVAGLLAAGTATHPAAAYVDYCRTDPIVHLSNGKVIQLRTTIWDAASDVSSVVYTVSAPAGMQVQSVTYTGGALAGKEVVHVVQAGNGQYAADTVVNTNINTADVAAQMHVAGIGFSAATGQSGQDLQLQVAS